MFLQYDFIGRNFTYKNNFNTSKKYESKHRFYKIGVNFFWYFIFTCI